MPLVASAQSNGLRRATPAPGADLHFELRREVGRILPEDVFLLPRVEVHLLGVVFAARPNHWSAEAVRESSLVVDRRPRAGHIDDDEARLPNPCDYPVVDLGVELGLVRVCLVRNVIDAKWLLVAAREQGGLDSEVVGV